jgi:hypothetical protein
MVRPVVSAAAEELYAALGTWRDRDGEATGWHLLHYCEALVGALQAVEDVARDTDAGPGWSSVVDLDRAPDPYLDWLAQFVGVVITPGYTPDAKRDLMRTQPGRARGRPAVLVAAAQTSLIGSKRVRLDERDSSAYHFTIETYASQTPDPAAVVAAVRAAKPGALQFDHVVLSGPTYTDVEAATPPGSTYADRKAMFPTYADVLDYVP